MTELIRQCVPHETCDLQTVLVHRVMEEIDEVVGDKTSVDADDLDKLTYMNQVSCAQLIS